MQNLILPQDILKCLGIEQCVVWNLVDDVGQVGKQVTLVLVCEDSGYACIVEFNIGVVNSHEVN
jgi:hypothetical protein